MGVMSAGASFAAAVEYGYAKSGIRSPMTESTASPQLRHQAHSPSASAA
jgi:hypothetical protein